MANATNTTATPLLQGWIMRDQFASQYGEFAAGIKPMAHGMLALSRIDTESEHIMVTDVVTKDTPFPHCQDINGPSKVVIGWVPGDFAFDVRAVTIEIGNGWHGNAVAQFGLVLPLRVHDPQYRNNQGYTVVTILNGLANSHRYLPSWPQKNGYLRYGLGLIKLNEAVTNFSPGPCGLKEVLGIDNAANYLVNALSDLGEYFTVLAEKLSSDHKH